MFLLDKQKLCTNVYRVYLVAIILILKNIRDDRNQAGLKVTMNSFIQFPENLGFDGG